MTNYIDLHMHTNYSDDGSYTPSQIVEMCHEAKVKIMAIADHNTVKGVEEGMNKAKELGMSYIPAIEIDCTYKNTTNLHVLGYGIDYTNPTFNALGENIYKQERSLAIEKLKKTNELFHVHLTEEQLLKIMPNGVFTGEAFGEALLNDPAYHDAEFLKPYREGGARSNNPYVNFYWDFYSQGKPIYVEVKYPTLEETIKLIKENGGIPVLAHPGNNLKGQFEVFDDMVKLGIEGVEAFSSYHTKETCEYFYNKAKEYDLLYTCGSDFHGKTKPSIFLGENNCSIDPSEIEEKLKAYHLI